MTHYSSRKSVFFGERLCRVRDSSSYWHFFVYVFWVWSSCCDCDIGIERATSRRHALIPSSAWIVIQRCKILQFSFLVERVCPIQACETKEKLWRLRSTLILRRMFCFSVNAKNLQDFLSAFPSGDCPLRCWKNKLRGQSCKRRRSARTDWLSYFGGLSAIQNVVQFITELNSRYFNYQEFTLQEVLLSLERYWRSAAVCKLIDCEALR